MDVNKKYCPDCHDWLPIEQFYKNRGNSDGRSWYCKKHSYERKMQHVNNNPHYRNYHRALYGARRQACGWFGISARDYARLPDAHQRFIFDMGKLVPNMCDQNQKLVEPLVEWMKRHCADLLAST